MVATRKQSQNFVPGPFTIVVGSDSGAEPAVVRGIGNTPLFRLRRLAQRYDLPDSVELWLKGEWTNPGGSIKDRPARSIVQSALAAGDLTDSRTLLDSTSGNTGIAYAMLGAAYDFPVELVVPENVSEERKGILAAYGAKVTYSDAQEGSDGSTRLAHEMANTRADRYFYADQYNNPANPAAHYATTGPELWRQTNGRMTHFVAALGTTGTLTGTGTFLREMNPDVNIVAVQPTEGFHGIEGVKHLATNIVPGIYDTGLPNRQIGVETEEAYDRARELAREEGLFAGISTGASLQAAVRIGKELAEQEAGGVIVVVAPDGGGRYLSTDLWTAAG